MKIKITNDYTGVTVGYTSTGSAQESRQTKYIGSNIAVRHKFDVAKAIDVVNTKIAYTIDVRLQRKSERLLKRNK